MTRTALQALSLQKPLIKVPYEGRTHLRERGRIMYLLTKWERRMGTYLARGHGERCEVRAP